MSVEREKKDNIIPISSEELLNGYSDLHADNKPGLIFDEPQFDIPDEIVEKSIFEDELGDKDLFIHINKEMFLYDKTEKQWMYWNEDYWRIDKLDESKNQVRSLRKVYQYYIERKKVEKVILKTMRDKKSENKNKENKQKEKIDNKKIDDFDNKISSIDNKIKKALERIQALSKDMRLKTILSMSKDGIDSLAYHGEEWDEKEKVLLLKNGSVDLKTGLMKPGDPLDYLKTPCPVKIKDRKKQPKELLKFMFSSYGGDVDLIKFIKKILGYSMLGVNEQQIFVIFYGWYGRNGKSVLFDTLKTALGEIMYKLPDNFLIKKTKISQDGAPNSALRALKNKKLVWCSEISAGDRIDIQKIKSLTGDEPISARGILEKKQQNFRAKFLPVMLTNRLPYVEVTDDAFWNRVLVIPHKLTFVRHPNPKKPHEKKIDFKVKDRLLKELPEIVNWLIEGALLYQSEGLSDIPKSVREATQEYKDNEDKIGFFLDEYYVTDDTEGVAQTSEMYSLYKYWCDESGYKPLGKIKFFGEVELRFERGNDRNTHYFEKVMLNNHGTMTLIKISERPNYSNFTRNKG